MFAHVDAINSSGADSGRQTTDALSVIQWKHKPLPLNQYDT